MSIYRRVLQYYRPFLGQTLIGLALTLCGIGLNLLKPWPFKIIVDDLIPRATSAPASSSLRSLDALLHQPRRALVILCLALVGIQLLWGLVNMASNFLFVKVGLQAL